MKQSLINWIKSYYEHSTSNGSVFDQKAFNGDAPYWTLGLFFSLLIASTLIWFVSRLILVEVMHGIAKRSKGTWDDHMMNNRVFKGFAFLVPLMFMEFFMNIVFFQYPEIDSYSHKTVTSLIILAAMIIVNRFFNAVRDIIMEHSIYRDKPIQSYTQVMKIVVFGVLIIAMLSLLTDKSPIFFLTSLGAISAVLLLVFRDTILGFVSSIQMASNDMIRIGDWVTMDKYGADGDVIEINLTTVKVQNFDNTITTIPTYSFISDSFRNWRGMQESDGRRIKRSIFVSIDTVQFATPELIESLKKTGILADYIEKKQKEIDDYNRHHGLEDDSFINKRRQTNLGLFRRYIEYYLRNNGHINNSMPLIVRQLQATEAGIPLEIYCFTYTKAWADYEHVTADIFDHIFAVVKKFDLMTFENPSGNDLRALKQ